MSIQAKSTEAYPALQGERSPRKWRTVKSKVTRQRIIDATLDCIVNLGYHRTTLAEIAKKSRATRGSVQYYFPTAQDALRATIAYLHSEWLKRYATAISSLNGSEDLLQDGVDVLWRLVQDPLNIAWQEIRAASRTDAALADLVNTMMSEIESTRRASDRKSYLELSSFNEESFEAASDFTNVFIEGLSLYLFVHRSEARKQVLIKMLVNFLSAFWIEAGLDFALISANPVKEDRIELEKADGDNERAISLIRELETVVKRLSHKNR